MVSVYLVGGLHDEKKQSTSVEYEFRARQQPFRYCGREVIVR